MLYWVKILMFDNTMKCLQVPSENKLCIIDLYNLRPLKFHSVRTKLCNCKVSVSVFLLPPLPSINHQFPSISPEHVPYVLVGAGTASFAAAKAIREKDPKAKVGKVSEHLGVCVKVAF